MPKTIFSNSYRAMLLGRRFDERLLSLQRQGRIGTFPPIKGQEAAQIGAVARCETSDWFVPAFPGDRRRDLARKLHGNVILAYSGFNEGGLIPEEQPRHVPWRFRWPRRSCTPSASAYAVKYRRQDEVVMTFFGDGATSEGDFHEALNFAGVFQTPVVFVCQNNQWAISVPRTQQTHSRNHRPEGAGLRHARYPGGRQRRPGGLRGGREAARAGQGRRRPDPDRVRHLSADDAHHRRRPQRYRDDEEVEAWGRRIRSTRFADVPER